MDKLFKSLLSIREIKLTTDDDCVDRLSRQYTVVLLVSFAFLVSTKQFVGKPIACWCPAHFTDSHRDYANAICWVSNTYYLPSDETLPVDPLARSHHRVMVGYYQWVPFILLFQAILTAVPSLFWRFANKRSGIHLVTIMDAAHVCCRASYLEIREKALRYIVNQMDRYLLAQRDHKTGCCIRVKHVVAKVCCLIGGRLYGNYLISAYLVVKALYLLNAVGHIFMLNVFLGTSYHMFGVYVITQLVGSKDWSQTNIFPRVTLCEFDIRHQSRVHSYIIQCALSVNLFNEKIFVFLWFWFVFLSVANVFNTLKWLFRALYWPGQVQYVRRQLRAVDAAPREPGMLAKFTESYLRRDGMFIIRLIGMNMGEVVAGEALCGLWNNYSPERRLVAEQAGRKKSGKMRLNGRSAELL